MNDCIETYKQMNLVEFLTDYYGLKFKKSGSGYVAGSPFGADKKPSFFVRQLGNRWLFKDFSSGLGGSIIDLVGHLEQLSVLARSFAGLNSWREVIVRLLRLKKSPRKPVVAMTWISFTIHSVNMILKYAVVICCHAGSISTWWKR